jgi:hypothetical protein
MKDTYIPDEDYLASLAAFVKRIDEESIFGGHEEPVIKADSLVEVLGESFGVWPECSRPDDEPTRSSVADIMHERLARNRKALALVTSRSQ